MKRILHISKYYYPFIGGTEQVARDCINALHKEYDQKVICFNEDQMNTKDLVDGIEIIRVGCFVKISSQSISYYYGRSLQRIIDEYKPDIIFFHYPNPFVAHYLLKMIHPECKLIVYWHLDIVKQKILKLMFVKQNKRIMNRANAIIATSPQYVEYSKYLSSVREKCVVIPNCINEDRVKITPSALRQSMEIREANKGKTICVAVGRHTKYKGFEYLIRAAHMLDDSFQFFLIGKGEETHKLISEANNDEKIHFLGSVSEDDLRAYMLAMDIFCFPSITRNEAFGVALVEAMYYGKPAVTFTIPGSGVNYVCLGNENGIEVSNRNVNEYAQAIRKLSLDKELRKKMGDAGKERVLSLFGRDNYRNSIQRLVDGI